jgi:hypothetical protein
MKVATTTGTVVNTDTRSRVETLSTSCVSLLSAVRPKLSRDLRRGAHGKYPHASGFTPQPASAFVMLVESDVSGGRHDILS